MAKDLDKVAEATDAMLGVTDLRVDDSAAMTRSIIERNLSAASDDELFAEQRSIPTKDIVGLPIVVESVRLAEGEIDGKPTVYMLIDAVNTETGEKILVNSGAPQVMSKLYNLHMRGRLPMQVYVAEAVPASKGRNAVLTLRRPVQDVPIEGTVKSK